MEKKFSLFNLKRITYVYKRSSIFHNMYIWIENIRGVLYKIIWNICKIKLLLN